MALESQYLNSHTIHHPCRRADLREFLKNLELYNYSEMFKYSSNFISKVGGSMGLWLGLGLVQAWQVLANTLSLFSSSNM